MKVLIVNTSEINGGSAKAANRLHKGLLALHVDSQMLVQYRSSDDRTIISSQTKLEKAWSQIKPTLDAIPLRLYPQRDRGLYSPQWLPSQIDSQIKSVAPDVINLHWIGSGYFSVETIAKFNRPIVWTLHDMWAFTGGCHYSQECDRFTQSCGRCPILNSNQNWDLSRWLWQRKAKAWRNIDLTIVTPSKWLAQCAAASSLFHNLRIEVIPNGLDVEKYLPIEKQLARKLMGIPPDKQIILFGAINATSNFRKGFHLLLPALQKLKSYSFGDRLELVVFGSSQPVNPPNFGFKISYLGKFSDDVSLALLYAAADIFVASSVQDNLPNTVVEAMACGTPCAAFNIGGIPDTIDHKKNGYLATAYEPEDLARGIAWILENSERWQNLSTNARAKVMEEFTVKQQAQSYLKLYQEILVNCNAAKLN